MRYFLLFLLLLTPLLGCSSDDPAAPGEPPADMDAYIADLPDWGDFAPTKGSFDGPTGEDPLVETVDFQGQDYTCTSTPYSITNSPEEVVTFDPDSEIFWLGALIQGKGHRDGIGSLGELPIRQRAPLKISINLLTEDNSRTVANPSLSTVQSAIGELIEAAQLAGHTAGSDIFFDKRTSYSLEQSSLKLGLTARYMGTEVRTSLDSDQTIEQHTLTAVFKQNMFTTSMELPQTPGDLFSSELTQSILEEQEKLGRIGPDNPPVYISSMTWGRMLILTMTSTRSVDEMRAALEASNDQIGGGSVDQHHLDVLEESEIRVVTIGGDAENALALLRTGQLSAYFAEDASLTSARPLSYTMRNMSGEIAVVSETTEYNIKECAPNLEVIGAVYKVDLTRLYLIDNGCDGGITPSPEVYYTFYVGTTNGLGNPVLQRSSGSAVKIKEGTSYDLGHQGTNVTIMKGSGVQIRVLGDAWDYDSASNDEHMGHWDLKWNYGVSNGERYFTRSGGGCTIRLYVNIVKVKDILGATDPVGPAS